MAQSNLQQAIDAAIQKFQAGNLREAAALCQQVLDVDPNHLVALHLYGVLAYHAQQNGTALELIRRALSRHRNWPEALNSLGLVLHRRGEYEEAISSYQQALRLRPEFGPAHYNLGLVYRESGRFDEAIACYERALAIMPGLLDAYPAMGVAWYCKHDLDQAALWYKRALTMCPTHAKVHSNLGGVYMDQGLVDEAMACFRRAHELQPNVPDIHSNVVYSLYFHPADDATAIYEECRRWNQAHAAPLATTIRTHTNGRDPHRRLRIGYVSPNLCWHPVGRFLLPLLEHRERSAVEVFCYPCSRVSDHLTQRLQAHSDHWHPWAGLSDDQAAELVRQDRIDILVDLAMHMDNNRLLAFARKPAPVQVTYLAYCGTTGLDAIDYRITDPFLDPSERTELRYSEQSVWMPDTYWCYQPHIDAPPVGPLPASTTGRLTFGCLNNFCKVSAAAIDAWRQILRAVPGSRLMLHTHAGSHRQRLRDLLLGRQVDPDRLEFVDFAPFAQYLAVYQSIDIGLDPFPYCGGTTTCDALWMGVPVVSLKGRTAVARAGLSILSNTGLPELVAHTPQEYVQRAVDLAADLRRLTELRASLRQRMQASPLMDARRFARNMESLYRTIWQRWCEKGQPHAA